MVVIPNGIDPAAAGATPIDLAELGVPPGRRAITFVGRLDPQKGLPWLLETALQWLPGCLTAICCWSAVAGSEPSWKSGPSIGIADRVHFAGWRPDVLKFLRRAICWSCRRDGRACRMSSSRRWLVACRFCRPRRREPRNCWATRPAPKPSPTAQTQVFSEKLVAIMTECFPCRAAGTGESTPGSEEFSLTRMIRAYEGLWESLVRL